MKERRILRRPWACALARVLGPLVFVCSAAAEPGTITTFLEGSSSPTTTTTPTSIHDPVGIAGSVARKGAGDISGGM